MLLMIKLKRWNQILMMKNKTTIIFLFICFSCFSSSYVVSQEKLRNFYEVDSLIVDYHSGFEYDVVVIYVNNVTVDKKILYSREETGNAYQRSLIEINNDGNSTIQLKILEPTPKSRF